MAPMLPMDDCVGAMEAISSVEIPFGPPRTDGSNTSFNTQMMSVTVRKLIWFLNRHWLVRPPLPPRTPCAGGLGMDAVDREEGS